MFFSFYSKSYKYSILPAFELQKKHKTNPKVACTCFCNYSGQEYNLNTFQKRKSLALGTN
ncbi:hypothetical protein LPBF_08615 [Flavobacterium crassostreae]|uniref:Uncharacterized protein n=1 Tax=Flavobacterium crassostreae TaxID=1763534 RepID=A0A1B9E0F9_9FLAO|nr:hypothetical protein LPBF_08615 [Flavobacterium crassostreae]